MHSEDVPILIPVLLHDVFVTIWIGLSVDWLARDLSLAWSSIIVKADSWTNDDGADETCNTTTKMDNT